MPSYLLEMVLGTTGKVKCHKMNAFDKKGFKTQTWARVTNTIIATVTVQVELFDY